MGVKRLGLCFVAAAVLAFAAIPASEAAAAKLLVLSSEGVEAPVGSAGDTGLFLAGCESFSEGKIGANGAAKDKVTAAKDAFLSCEEGVSESGVITESSWAGSGKGQLKGTIEITMPGPCTYVFKKFKGTFEVPGSAVISGPTVGKLNKKTSSTTCAKTNEQEFLADAAPEPHVGPFEVALKE